jgi:hypothetical protein
MNMNIELNNTSTNVNDNDNIDTTPVTVSNAATPDATPDAIPPDAVRVEQSVNHVQNNNNNDDDDDAVHSDELDEDIENKLKQKLSPKELNNTFNSFENPVGMEEDPHTKLENGPNLTPAQISKLYEELQKMSNMNPALKSILEKNTFGMGDNDFRRVNEKHKNKVQKNLKNETLKQRLEAMKLRRSKRVIRDAAVAKSSDKLRAGTKINDNMGIKINDNMGTKINDNAGYGNSCNEPNCTHDHSHDQGTSHNNNNNDMSDLSSPMLAQTTNNFSKHKVTIDTNQQSTSNDSTSKKRRLRQKANKAARIAAAAETETATTSVANNAVVNTNADNANTDNTNTDNTNTDNTNVDNTNVDNTNVDNTNVDNTNVDNANVKSEKKKNKKRKNKRKNKDKNNE